MMKKDGECCGGGTGGCMPHGGHHKCKGVLLLLIGVAFLLGTLGYVPEITFVKYWPVVLILVGLHKLLCSCCENK